MYNERVEDLNSVTQQRDEIRKQYDEWRKRRLALFFVPINSDNLFAVLRHKCLISYYSHFRLDEFMAGFNTISLKLKEMYQVCPGHALFPSVYQWFQSNYGVSLNL